MSRLARRRSLHPRVPSMFRGAPMGRRSANFVGLLVTTVGLNLLGLAMVLSASTIESLELSGSSFYYFERQIVWAFLGLCAMVFFMRIDYRELARFAKPGLGIMAVMLLFVLLPGVGVHANGSTRWLGTSTLSIQPAEFAKVAVALFCAAWLSEQAANVRDTRVTLRPVMVISLVIAGLVLAQRSQGTAMIIVAIAVIMLFVSGTPLLPLGRVMLALGTVAALFAWMQDYRRARILALLDPWDDPLGASYQSIQSMVGVASGGLTGVGLGAGKAKWGFLPFAHTDFIFAVIAEELGLVGSALVVLAFVAIVFFGWRTALAAPDRFGMLLAAGLTTWIALQAFINIAVVLSVFPISGVPLPFVSIGGSSLITTMMAMGIVLNIARQERRLERISRHPSSRSGGAAADRSARSRRRVGVS